MYTPINSEQNDIEIASLSLEALCFVNAACVRVFIANVALA